MIVTRISQEEFESNALGEADILWKKVLTEIEKKVHAQSYATWFKPILPLEANDQKLVLEVPSLFFYDWIESHYHDLIRTAINDILGQSVTVDYKIKQNQQKEEETEPVKIEIKSSKYNQHNHMIQELPDHNTQLKHEFTFDNFIEGDGNKFARAAALAVGEAPGRTAFNPLVIFGGTGMGKTHLMHAIGNFSKEVNEEKKVYYVTSEQFTTDFINSIQKNKTSEFSSFYRNIDILLIDDIQFFSNKGKTQEEFFHTFNSLHMAGKQIILTCDRPPNEIKDLEDRLLSRFQWGLVVDIQPPDFETRVAIINNKADESGLRLPSDVSEYLASNITNSIRELEGALIRLMAQASITGDDLNLELARSVIQRIGKQKKQAITIETIMKETALYFGIQENLLLEKTRKKEIVIARQISMYLAKMLTSHTVKSIGLHFGGRDHTTVLYSVKMIEDQLNCDKRTAEHIENIRKQLENM